MKAMDELRNRVDHPPPLVKYDTYDDHFRRLSEWVIEIMELVVKTLEGEKNESD